MSRRNRHPAFREDPPPFRETLNQYLNTLTHEELTEVMFKLLDHLKLSLVRTNCTKHGDTQLLLEDDEL